MQSVELAGGNAGAEAQTAEGAGGRAAGDLERAHAVGNADVLEVFHSGIAAVADDVSDHLLTAGRFHAHDRGDLGSALRAGGRAGGDGSLAGEDRFRAAGAAGVAAAAAVRAGQALLDLGQTLVDLDLKDLCGDREDQAEHDRDRAQNEESKNDIFHIPLPSLHGPALQAGEAHECQGDQTCGDQRDGEAFKALGIVGELHALTDGGEQVDRQQEAEAAGDEMCIRDSRCTARSGCP